MFLSFGFYSPGEDGGNGTESRGGGGGGGRRRGKEQIRVELVACH